MTGFNVIICSAGHHIAVIELSGRHRYQRDRHRILVADRIGILLMTQFGVVIRVSHSYFHCTCAAETSAD